jgi:O-antigen/teichoic acid export membrane protein
MIVLYLSSKEYMGATEVVGILCTTIFISNCYIFFPGLSLAQKTASISIVNVLGMIVNVVLNFVFIPIYGILAAATATLISALFTFVVHFTLSQRHYALPITSSRLLITLMVLLMSVFTLQKVL